MALRLGHWADRRRGDRRDSARSLRFGCRLLGSSQRRLGWNDHPLVASHWSIGSRGCRGSRVLKKSPKVCFQLKQRNNSIALLLSERHIKLYGLKLTSEGKTMYFTHKTTNLKTIN